MAAREFMYASIQRGRFLRWRITIALATLLVFALIAAGIAVLQLRVAGQQQTAARRPETDVVELEVPKDDGAG